MVNIEQRSDAAGRAVAYFGKRIRGQCEDIASEMAAELGAFYTVYHMEMWLALQDSFGSTLQDSKADETTKTQRLMAELAIMDAERGNYSGVRAYLTHVGDSLLEIIIDKEAGNAFKKVAAKIPDTGSPFKAPPPAWKDPQFSNPSEN